VCVCGWVRVREEIRIRNEKQKHTNNEKEAASSSNILCMGCTKEGRERHQKHVNTLEMRWSSKT